MAYPRGGKDSGRPHTRSGSSNSGRGLSGRARSRGRGRRGRGRAASRGSNIPPLLSGPPGPGRPLSLLGPPPGISGMLPPPPNFSGTDGPPNSFHPTSDPNVGGVIFPQGPLQMNEPPHDPNWQFHDPMNNDHQNGPFLLGNNPFPENRGNWRGKHKKRGSDQPKVEPTIFPHGVPPIHTSFNITTNGETLSNPPLPQFIQKDESEETSHSKETEKPNQEKSVTELEIKAPNPLVDPALMELETNKYYEEVAGSIQIDRGAKEKPKGKTKKPAPPPKEVPKPIDTQTAWATMHEYWNYVQENPYDFDGWTRLLGHVEGMESIEAARSAFEGFLPLYPYCFAYWKKLSDFEKKYSNLDTSIGVLLCAINSVPLCTEIWIPLFDHFIDYARHEVLSDNIIRGFYERGLESLGLAWQGSLIWERAIDFEMSRNNLRKIMTLYKRVIKVPLKVYNKHWDRLIALVRDNLPQELLSPEEYTNLRKSSCEEMKIVYTPLPKDVSTSSKKASDSDDKLTTTIREKIIVGLIRSHERTEKEVNKRSKYEEKIKRPYFHIKPLEKKQLRTWNDYLDYEIKQGDPVRIVFLFERCLVACAQYELMWCRYIAFMEEHVLNVLKGLYANIKYQPGCLSKAPPDSKKKRAKSEEESTKDSGSLAETKKGVSKVVGKPNSSSKETNASKKTKKTDKVGSLIDCPPPETNSKVEDKDSTLETSVLDPLLDKNLIEMYEDVEEDDLEVTSVRSEVTSMLTKLREQIGVGGRVLTCPPLSPHWILHEVTWEDVRQLYRRAAWIHCPSKPLILMQWAEFEEAQDNAQTARELLNTVIVKYPGLLKARLQLIELERRNGFLDRADELYSAAFKISTSASTRSFIAIRYARFLFKIKEEDEKALMVLRKALKKDKGNIHLYHHVFDVCYQRRPIDQDGVQAAVLLALASKELSLEQKYSFCQKRSDFLKEHGTLLQLKEANVELNEYKKKVEAEKEAEAKLAKEKQKQDAANEAAQPKWSNNQKLVLAPGRGPNDLPVNCIPLPPHFNPYRQEIPNNFPGPSPIYNTVPPTFDLDHPSYGYGKEKDKDIQGERMMYERYDDLLKKGYSDMNGPPGPCPPRNHPPESYLPPPPIPQGILGESLFNQGRVPEHGERGPNGTEMGPPPNFMGPPPLNQEPRFNDQGPMGDSPFGPNLRGPPPDGPNMHNHPGNKRPMFDNCGGPPNKMPLLDVPPMNFNNRGPEFNFPHKIPQGSFVNIPPWFVTDGGQYILSTTTNGQSIIRYWPLYMNENGHNTLFDSIRQSVKWFPPQRGQNEPPHQLLSWMGPCDYKKDGIYLRSNTKWPPEIVDLLHRLIRFVEHEGEPFNSCLLGLFLKGNNFCPWSTEEHPAMNAKSKIATVSLGATRVLEMKRKDGSCYLRFPLFPGSLLVMEGATQQDWIHQVAPDANIMQERLSLSFRSMLMIKGLTV